MFPASSKVTTLIAKPVPWSINRTRNETVEGCSPSGEARGVRNIRICEHTSSSSSAIPLLDRLAAEGGEQRRQMRCIGGRMRLYSWTAVQVTIKRGLGSQAPFGAATPKAAKTAGGTPSPTPPRHL